jgi:hypothetical protein
MEEIKELNEIELRISRAIIERTSLEDVKELGYYDHSGEREPYITVTLNIDTRYTLHLDYKECRYLEKYKGIFGFFSKEVEEKQFYIEVSIFDIQYGKIKQRFKVFDKNNHYIFTQLFNVINKVKTYNEITQYEELIARIEEKPDGDN